MWRVPLVFAVSGIALEEVVAGNADVVNPLIPIDITTSAATAVLSAVAGSMMTVTGIVFSVLTLTVQQAGSAVSPRAVRTFYRDVVVKLSLGMFVGTFTYSLRLIPEVDGPARNVGVVVAVILVVAATATFLVMVNHVSHGLRAASMVDRVGKATSVAIGDVHPRAADFSKQGRASAPNVGCDHLVFHRGRRGVVMAVNHKRLARYSRRTGTSIHLLPQVGDFLAEGDPVFETSGPLSSLQQRRLGQQIAVGEERSIDQDPAFGLRILADTAARALSPGVNDPTSAVVALDQIEHLLSALGRRHLGGELGADSDEPLFWAPKPTWEGYLNAALVEVADYGSSTFQVTRRLYSLFNQLEAVLPPERHPAIDQHRRDLDRRVARSFADAADRAFASIADRQGLGAATPRATHRDLSS